MDSADLQASLLDQLNRLIVKMTSPEWDVTVQSMPDKQQKQAQKQLLLLQQARRIFSNAQLEEIAADLTANEPAIVTGQKAVQASVDSFATAETVLKTASAVLKTLAKVVPLA